MRLAIVGAPGTDACTLGRLVASRLGAQHVSMRRLIDLEVNHQTALGVSLAKELGSKALLPIHLVAPLIDQLWSGGRPSNFVLSGYPRNAQQWRHLRRHTDVSQIIHVRSSSEFLKASVAQRCVCPACAAGLYPDDLDLGSGQVLPAVLECCGSTRDPAPVSRDAPAIFSTRLSAYEQITVPWLDSQRDSGLVQDVWADARWPQVFPVLEKLLGLAPSVSAAAAAADAPSTLPGAGPNLL